MPSSMSLQKLQCFKFRLATASQCIASASGSEKVTFWSTWGTLGSEAESTGTYDVPKP